MFASLKHCHCSLLCSGVSPSTALVRKLIAVLESIEKLPVYNYDSPGAGYGLQVDIVPILNNAFCLVIYSCELCHGLVAVWLSW